MSTNDKLGADVLVFAGTSDNELSVAPGVDLFLNYNNAVRCISHSFALAVNDAVREAGFVVNVLALFCAITSYMNNHAKVDVRLIKLQCDSFARDRIVIPDREFSTGWHSKLNVLEKYTILRPYIRKVLPVDASAVLRESEDECIAECILVLCEVRRVARLLDADRRVIASRVPRQLSELYDTLRIFVASRVTRSAAASSLCLLRRSIAKDDEMI